MDIQAWADRMNRIRKEISDAWYDADPLLPEKTASAVSAWAYRAESDWRQQIQYMNGRLLGTGYHLTHDDNEVHVHYNEPH